MSDGERYSRITDLIELIIELMTERSSKGITLKEIMEKYNCARSTAVRMRNCLLYSGIGIEELYKDDNLEIHWGFSNLTPYMSKFVPITTEDIANLKLVQKALPQKNKVAISETISKIEALCKCKKNSVEEEIDSIMSTEYVVNKQKSNYKIDIDVLKNITFAIRNSYKIKAKYKGEERILSPLGLISKDKTYLVAKRDSEEGEVILNYSLHKISDVHVIYQKFDRESFDLKEYSNRSFGVWQDKKPMKVELLFDKETAEDVLAYNFHPTQKFQQKKDGSISVKFIAGGQREIIWHLFTWGNKVKILAPKSLKKYYKDYLETVLETVKEK